MKRIIIQNEEVNWNKTSLMAALEMANYIKPADEPINMIEFGVYTGDSICLATQILNHYKREHTIIGVDSFEGLPEESKDIDRYEHYKPGGFGDVFTKTCRYANAKLIKKWFKDLIIEDINQYNIKHFDVIHMDCDLHISTIQAWTFLLDNGFIDDKTIVTYDEFKSTKRLYAGGESLAHKEISEKYKIEFKEFFRNQYYDDLNKLEFWQNTFLINSIGKTSDIGLINIETDK